MQESRFPSFASGKNRLRSTAFHERTTPLVPIALRAHSPNRGRRVAFGSKDRDFRHRLAGFFALAVVLLLTACASGPPAPVEEREVETRVRAPAREDSEGVQVYALKNPAVEQLTSDAVAAENIGRYDQAAVLLERALRIQPRNPELLQHMAEVQLQKQDYDQALSFAARSYDTGPRVGEICNRNWRTISVAREYLGDRGGAREAERRAGECMNTRPASY